MASLKKNWPRDFFQDAQSSDDFQSAERITDTSHLCIVLSDRTFRSSLLVTIVYSNISANIKL